MGLKHILRLIKALTFGICEENIFKHSRVTLWLDESHTL